MTVTEFDESYEFDSPPTKSDCRETPRFARTHIDPYALKMPLAEPVRLGLGAGHMRERAGC